MSTAAIARDPEIDTVPLTRAQYDRLVEAGDFEGQHVELLEGVVVALAPQGDEHWSYTHLIGTELAFQLRSRFGRRYSVGQQGPIAASGLSEPEPDIVVVDRTTKPVGGHPVTSPLVIEIARTSQRKDLRHKPVIYARAEVTDYWVVDLKARRVVVHRQPSGTGYLDVRSLPLDTDLDVLGITVNISEIIG